MAEEKSYKKYITEEALTAISVMEGYGEKHEDPDGLPTGAYGLVEDTLKMIQRSSLIELPEELKKVKYSTMTTAQERDIVGYYTEMISKQFDGAVEKYQPTNPIKFTSLPLDIRSAILTKAIKNGSGDERFIEGYIKACSNINDRKREIAQKSNILWNAVNKDRESIAKAAMIDPETGEIRESYTNKKPRNKKDPIKYHNGRLNRDLLMVKMLYDPDCGYSINLNTGKDSLVRRWRNEHDKGTNIPLKVYNLADTLQHGNIAVRGLNNVMNAQNFYNYNANNQNQNTETQNYYAMQGYTTENIIQQQAKQQNESKGFFGKIKDKLFGNSSNLQNDSENLLNTQEEQPNGTQRNGNINLQ